MDTDRWSVRSSYHGPGRPRAADFLLRQEFRRLRGWQQLLSEGRKPDRAAVYQANMLAAMAEIDALVRQAAEYGLVDPAQAAVLTGGKPDEQDEILEGLWARGCDCDFCDRERATGVASFEGRLTNRP